MSILNNFSVILCIGLIFFSCKDDISKMDDLRCNSYCDTNPYMDCIDGQCLCPDENFFTPFLHNDRLCNDLNASFYVRVGHEGNIDYFKPMDILKMPDSSSIYSRSTSSLSKRYPEEFIVEWFASRSDTFDYDKYPLPHIALVFENNSPSNDDFPMRGSSDLSPANYSPQEYLRPIDGVYYGIKFDWYIEFTEDLATLHIDVYSTGNGSVFLDDQITMYFERYR